MTVEQVIQVLQNIADERKKLPLIISGEIDGKGFLTQIEKVIDSKGGPPCIVMVSLGS